MLKASYDKILTKFGLILAEKGFLIFQITENIIFDSRDYASSKTLGKSDEQFSKKNTKNHFGPKNEIWTVFGVTIVKMIKKGLGTFSPTF